jgi:hypothetical protein
MTAHYVSILDTSDYGCPPMKAPKEYAIPLYAFFLRDKKTEHPYEIGGYRIASLSTATI